MSRATPARATEDGGWGLKPGGRIRRRRAFQLPQGAGYESVTATEPIRSTTTGSKRRRPAK